MPRSKVNIATSDTAVIALSHAIGGRKKFGNFGTLKAARSPQIATLLSALDPHNPDNANRLSVYKDGSGNPKVKMTVKYRPQYEGEVFQSRVVTTGDEPEGAEEVVINMDTHREQRLTYQTADFFALEKAAEEYLNQVNGGAVASSASITRLSNVGDEILRRVEPLFASANSVALTALVAGVGANLMLTDPTGVPVIQAFKSDGSINPFVWDWLNELVTTHEFEGVPIVIGGKVPMRFFNREKIASTASNGLDFEKMFEELPVEFHYDPAIDLLLGEGQIIVIDPGAFGIQTVSDTEIIGNDVVANTSYSEFSISVAQSVAETFTLRMDLRVREEDTAFPRYTIIPSVRMGTFTRPAGFHMEYGGWEDVTGIFRAKLV